MVCFENIFYDKFILRSLEIIDCNENYLNWLNDKEVNKFLETRLYPQSIKSIQSFVDEINKSEHSYLFGIFYKEDNNSLIHIGNVKIGPIHKFYSYADISYFIGDKNYWGKGLATKVIKAVLKFGFEVLNLNRIQAGVFSSNIASIKVLEKAGLILEGNFRKQLYTKDLCDDHLFYGILKEDWLKNYK